MQLHCFGTAGYHPNEGRHTSAYFLPESNIALDAGSGFFRLEKHIQQDSIDILISHAHLDHVMGLTYLLDASFREKISKIRIWGEEEKVNAIQDHLFNPLLFPARLDAEWNTIKSGDQWEIRGMQLTCKEQEHPGGSLAYRIDWPDGRRLVYATDTTGDTSETHAQWSRQADLLIHECYFTDSESEWAEVTGHSWTSRVAQVVKQSSPKKVLLTHLNPMQDGLPPSDLEAIRAQVVSEVIVAEDHLCVNF